MIFPSWANILVFFDLRFGFLVKNYIYGQMLVKIDQNSDKLINKLKCFINLNLGLILGGLGPPDPPHFFAEEFSQKFLW